RMGIADTTTADTLCAVCIDMGTTNSRAWLLAGDRVLARSTRSVGVRDTAREKSKAGIHAALTELIDEMRIEAREASPLVFPTCVVGAGMVGSPLGLAELPHRQAPAGIRELAESSRWIQMGQVTDLPILLIPGVRAGPARPSLSSVGGTDVMRGEETLCIGLGLKGLVEPPALVLNLGSHWKAIQIDGEGRIASSVTTLSGELIHSAQIHTVLAS